jgi:hypothetical protein
MGEVAALVGLMAASLVLRATGIENRLWMDEGISVGIASHPLTEIPSVLRLDGSPPLYYVLLHVWMGVAGRSETALHALSVAFAVLCVPAGWWMGRSAMDRRTGWVVAVLVACCPFVTHYAGDARMYTLVVLLGLVCVACFLGAFVHGRRGCVVWFGVALAWLLYTHNWALFLAVAFVLAFAAVWVTTPRDRRSGVLRDGAIGFAIAGLLYLPWLPTAFFQARHTGAPWATAPHLSDLARIPTQLLGDLPTTLIVVVAAGAGLARLALGSPRERPALVTVLAMLATVPVLLGWTVSQTSPAWASRYLAIVVAPALLLAAIGIANARRPGLGALAVVVLLWATADVPTATGNIFQIARDARPFLDAGDLVVSAAPAQVPLLAYYLPPALRFASPFGVAHDPGVMDWRDAMSHLDRTSVSGQLLPLLARARRGSDLILVVPARSPAARETPWARAVQRRAAEYEQALLRDRRFALVARLPPEIDGAPTTNPFRGFVFRKRHADRR